MPPRTTKDKVRFSLLAGLPAGFAAVTLGKLLSNVAFRLVFPFLPRIAEGLGVSLTALGTSLAIRELAALSTPALGRAADRRGHNPAMVVGLVALGVFLVIQGASNELVLFTIALVGVTVAKGLFDVAAGAWVGDAVPFHARGRGIGLLETSWALAFIIGIPIAALLVRISTWRTPFLVTAVLCTAMAGVLHVRLPRRGTTRAVPPAFTWSARALTASVLLVIIGTAQAMLLVTFASWLEDEHGLSVAGIGITAMVIGFAELAGSVGTARFSDRIGLGKSLRITLAGAAGASVLLIAGSSSLTAAIISMGLYFLVVEASIVTLLSVFSELDPDARATAFGVAFAGFAVGHAIGALSGALVYENWGMTENAITMAVLFGIGFLMTGARLRPVELTP
ncbi:MAG: MFS transporter [Acidimicrobiales bacterium]